MPVVLYRVDDRLVHGQVVLGWGRAVGIDFIVLVDDQVRESAWEQDLYRMGVPPEVELIFASVEEAGKRLATWEADGRRGILLAGDIAAIIRMRESGARIPRLNLGGVHHRPGRTLRLPYVYLSDEELRTLRDLEAGGVEITAQDLPATAPVPLRSLG